MVLNMKKITAILLMLIMVTAFLVSCGETGDDETQKPVTVPEGYDASAVAVSAGDTALTVGDLTYIFATEYQNFLLALAESSLTPSVVKLDTAVSLREQEFGMGSSHETWFDYFAEAASEAASEAVMFTSAAKAEGIELNEDEKAAIDISVADIMKAAEESGTSAQDVLGYGVTEENVRAVITVTTYAAKYIETKIGEADISDEAIDALYEEYKYSYEKVDYMVYGFDYKDLIDSDATEAEIDAAKATTQGYIDEMAALTDEESFRAYAKENMINVLGLSESEADSQFRNLVVQNASYSEKDPLSVWAFSAEVGDVRVEETEDGAARLYMLFADKGRDEAVTARDVRHILFTHETYKDDTKAREVYDKWVSDGASVDELVALAAEYSEDPGSAQSGGLYEGVTAGEMSEEFNDWLFDSDREVGDHALVETADHGWHIMYYEGGEPTWRADMIERIQNEAYVNALTGARESHPAEVKKESLGKLPA